MFGKRKAASQERKVGDLRARARGRTSFNYYAGSATSSSRSETPKAADTSIDMGSVKHRLRLVPTIIALSIIVISLLISFTLSTRPGVTTLNDEASPYRSSQEYADAAEEILSAKPGNRTKLTIDTAAVEQAMLERFPELRAAVLRLPVLGRKPTLVLDINAPSILLATNKGTYVLDSVGTVVSDVRSLDEDARAGLLVIRDQSGLELAPGAHALTSESVQFITEVTGQLEAQGIQATELTLPATANQLDLRIEGVSYYIKFDLGGDARLQAGSYLAVKQRLEGEGITPSEYVDVRVEEKVFYK